jgi:uncharacterized YigZ family protein
MSTIYSYNTLSSPSEGAYHASGSKFLAYAFPVKDKASLQEHLAELKALHPTARHQCYAYRLLERNEITEYSSDAGEPSGSAGAPILGEMRRNELVNVLVIVVRYFGGTKLGIPGLINAYRESAHQALAHGNVVVRHQMLQYTISLPVGLQPKLYHACKHYGIEIEEPEYGSLFSANLNIALKDHEEQVLQLLMMIAGKQGTKEQLMEWLGATLK